MSKSLEEKSEQPNTSWKDMLGKSYWEDLTPKRVEEWLHVLQVAESENISIGHAIEKSEFADYLVSINVSNLHALSEFYPDDFTFVDIYKDKEPQISSVQLSEMKSWLLQRLGQLEEWKNEPKID